MVLTFLNEWCSHFSTNGTHISQRIVLIFLNERYLDYLWDQGIFSCLPDFKTMVLINQNPEFRCSKFTRHLHSVYSKIAFITQKFSLTWINFPLVHFWLSLMQIFSFILEIWNLRVFWFDFKHQFYFRKCILGITEMLLLVGFFRGGG